MKVTDVSALALTDEIPPAEQHRTDLGTKVRTHSTLVFVETSEGLTGIGTALGDPSVTTTLVERLGDAAIGEDPMDSGRIWEKMYNGSRWEPAIKRGHPQPRSDRRGTTLEAMAGIDIALWDLKGKICDQPLYKLLGGVRDSIRGYASGGWAPGRRTADELGGYVEEGFDAVKMRVEGEDGFSLDTATTRVEAAREGIGDDVALMVDAHGSLETSTAIRLASRLEPYDIDWFEEPVTPDDHDALAEVRSSTKIPIAAGEREFTRFDARSLLERNAVDVIQPDVARAGGITETRRIAALASAHGVRMVPHAWGNGVLFAATLHLSLATPNCHLMEVGQAHKPLQYDLFEEPLEIADGRVHAPDRPGLGYTLQSDLEERFPYRPGPEYIY